MTTRDVLRSWTNGLGAKGAVWGACLALVLAAYAVSGRHERLSDTPMPDSTWPATTVAWVDHDDAGEEALGDFDDEGEGPVMFVAREDADDERDDEDEADDRGEVRDSQRGRHAHSGPPRHHRDEARPSRRAHYEGGRGPKQCDACERRRGDGLGGECDACAKRGGDGPGHRGHAMHRRPMGPPPGHVWGRGFGRGPHGGGALAAARHGHPGFGHGPGLPLDGPHARLMHLQRAARHLNAAGMKDLSEQVHGELEKAREEAVSQSPRGEPMRQRLDQLHQDVEKLHGLIERLAGLLPKVSMLEPTGEPLAQPAGDLFIESPQVVVGTVDSTTSPSPAAEVGAPVRD